MGTLTQKSQITIPKSIRKFLGIGPGDEVEFGVEGKKVVLHKKDTSSVIENYRGLLGASRISDVMDTLR